MFLYNYFIKFRYNFSLKRGEVKVVREFRQRCSQLQSSPVVHPWQYPLLDEGQAGWIMKKLAFKIKMSYYEERFPAPKITHKNFTGLEHHRDDCEACSLGRCPRNRWRVDPNMRRGREDSNVSNLEHVKWVILDENDHVFDL